MGTIGLVVSGCSCPTEYDCERYVFGVGCKGMGKGICGLDPCSLLDGGCDNGPSPKKVGLPTTGGTVDVGDGKTSDNLEGGSFRSVFQMPVPHVKVGAWCPRLRVVDEECGPQGPAPVSRAGVLGCDAVGDMELLANDPFLG